MLLLSLRVLKVLCLATVPFFVAAVFWKDFRLAAAAFVCLSAICAYLGLRALRDGFIDTRNHGRVCRADSPGSYWFNLTLLGAVSLFTGIVAVLAFCGVVTIHQQAPW